MSTAEQAFVPRAIPHAVIDMTGRRFGHLLVREYAGRSATNPGGQPRTRWRCLCDCGQESVVTASALRRGQTKSCGCGERAAAQAACERRVTHGESRKGRMTPEMHAWRAMQQRCYQPSHNRHKHYAARGTVVCERWLNSFAAFLADMGRRPSPNHSIDRIDNSGNYERATVGGRPTPSSHATAAGSIWPRSPASRDASRSGPRSTTSRSALS